MVWIELESFWLGSPAFADELVWCEAFERLEPTSKIIGVHEVAQMSSQLIVTVYSNEQIEFALLRPDFGNVDMEEADRIGLELFLRFLVTFNIRQTADAMTLEAAMQ